MIFTGNDKNKSSFGTNCCILFATADWDEPYWTNKQHCAKELAKMGIKVLYVESIALRRPKANSNKDIKRILSRIRKSTFSYLFGPIERLDQVYVVSPLMLPGVGDSSIKKRVNEWMLNCLVRLSARRLKFKSPLIWTYHPFIGDTLELCCTSNSLYHCVDDLSAVPGIDARKFQVAEARLLKQVDACFVTAPHLKDQCLQYNPNTYYLSNVVDIEHFSREERSTQIPDDILSLPEPRIVYHGVLSDFKINFELLIECAKLRPKWSFIFIGEEREGQKDRSIDILRKSKNVHFLGYKTYEELPSYLQNMNVGMLPSLINSYTTSMFPMKFYEFIASGIPVASTPLDFTKYVDEGLLIGKNTSEFINAIELQLSRGRLSKQDSELIIGENTWEQRTVKMLEALKRVK